MKVGLIGLNRRGEGMSRRMMKEGIEVWGYKKDYQQALISQEDGIVAGVATTIENLAWIVHHASGEDKPIGVFEPNRINATFIMDVPADKVEETVDELIPHCDEGDIIIDYSNRDVIEGQEMQKYCSKLGISYILAGTYGAAYAIAACSKIFNCLSPAK